MSLELVVSNPFPAKLIWVNIDDIEHGAISFMSRYLDYAQETFPQTLPYFMMRAIGNTKSLIENEKIFVGDSYFSYRAGKEVKDSIRFKLHMNEEDYYFFKREFTDINHMHDDEQIVKFCINSYIEDFYDFINNGKSYIAFPDIKTTLESTPYKDIRNICKLKESGKLKKVIF